MSECRHSPPIVFAIVPAAGASRRMGRPKLLLPWGSTTVLGAVVAAWRAGGVERIVVVARREDHALAKLCRELEVELCLPPIDPPDMKESVRWGVRRGAEKWRIRGADAWLLAPADMPRLAPAVVRRLIESHQPLAPAVLVPTWQGKRGHPILFPWIWREQLDTLASDEGVNALIARLPVRELATDEPDVRGDLDTWEDYLRARPADTSPAGAEPVD